MFEEKLHIFPNELTFISDEKLTRLVSQLLIKADMAADSAGKKLYRNVVDPFSALFDSARQKIELEEWQDQEKSRQIQKSLQNFLGEFHQEVIGSINGWESLGTGSGVDVRSSDKKIIAEIKNKYNTMNSGKAVQVYDEISRHLDFNEPYKGYISYIVFIIPKSPIALNKIFSPSDKGTRRPQREDVRQIDGKSFYHIATGDPEAIKKLYCRLPVIISKVSGTLPEKLVKSPIYSDLFNRAYS